MFLNEIKNELNKLKGGEKELKAFGITLTAAFGLIACLMIWRGRPFVLPFILSIVFLLPAIFVPEILKVAYKPWMAFAFTLGFVMTRVMLVVLFYLVISPVSLIAKCFGKKFLDLSWKQNQPSYWTRREAQKDRLNYERQF